MSMNNNKVLSIVRKYKTFFILIAVAVVLGCINPSFLTGSNLTNIFKQISTNAILAAGMSFVILTGGIDISVGASLALVGAISVGMIRSGVNIVIVIACALVIGAMVGLINGVFIAKFRLQPMIVTLATMSICRGLTYIYTKGSAIPLDLNCASGQIYKWIGKGSLFGVIPFQLVLVILAYAVSYYMLNKMTIGRRIYAVGGNEEATRLSGINTTWTKIFAYIMCGVMTAIAALMISARVSSAQPNAGESYEMDAIAAVVIGGTSLRGGEGKVLYTIIGALIIGMLNNFLNLSGVDSYYQVVVKGVVILIAVLMDSKAEKS